MKCFFERVSARYVRKIRFGQVRTHFEKYRRDMFCAIPLESTPSGNHILSTMLVIPRTSPQAHEAAEMQLGDEITELDGNIGQWDR